MNTINEYTASIFSLEGKTALVTGGATGIGYIMTGAIIPLDGGMSSARTLGLEQGIG